MGEVAAWLAHLRASGKSANTRDAYRVDVGHLERWLDGRGVRDLGPADLLLWDVGLAGKPSTRERRRSAVLVFLRWLNPERWRGFAWPDDRRLPDPVPAPADPATVAVLLAEPREGADARRVRDWLACCLMAQAGLTASEVVALDLADAQPHLGCLRVAEPRGGWREVPTSPLIERALGRWLELRPRSQSQALLLNHRGWRLTRQGVWLALRERCARAGLEPVAPMALRHRYALDLLAGGATDRDVAAVLGLVNVPGMAGRYGRAA